MVGREHTIEIGPMAGEHNVRFFLRKHGIEEHPVYVEKILAAAKRSNRLLSEDDVRHMVKVLRERLNAGGQVEDSELDAAVKAKS
mgnify:FL=1